MMSRSHILKKGTAGYKHSKSQERINHLMYMDATMDGTKLFPKNGKEQEALTREFRIYSQDIKIEFGTEKYTTLVMKSDIRQLTDRMESR